MSVVTGTGYEGPVEPEIALTPQEISDGNFEADVSTAPTGAETVSFGYMPGNDVDMWAAEVSSTPNEAKTVVPFERFGEDGRSDSYRVQLPTDDDANH